MRVHIYYPAYVVKTIETHATTVEDAIADAMGAHRTTNCNVDFVIKPGLRAVVVPGAPTFTTEQQEWEEGETVSPGPVQLSLIPLSR